MNKLMLIEKFDMVFAKLTIIIALSAIPAGSFSILQELTGWYVGNREFMYFISAAIIIDHLLGSWVHWRIIGDFSWKKNQQGLFVKVAGSVCGYILFEMLYQILQDVDFLALYFKVLLQAVTFFYPFMSAAKNLSILTGGKFPSEAILGKFTQFDKTADLNALKPTKNETESINPNSNNADPI